MYLDRLVTDCTATETQERMEDALLVTQLIAEPISHTFFKNFQQPLPL